MSPSAAFDKEGQLPTTGVPVLAPGQGTIDPPPLGKDLADLPLSQLLALIERNVAGFQTCKLDELFVKVLEAVQAVVRLDAVEVILFDRKPDPVAARLGKCKSNFTREDALLQVRRGETAFVSREFLRSPSTRLEVAVVAAAPLMNRDRQVIGMLYGERQSRSEGAEAAVTNLEALLLQQLARETSLALDRLQEAEVVSLTRFMSEKQARAVLRDPERADSKKVTVTVLFCDIEGFTNITEQENEEQVFGWSGAVLRHLTECVLKYEGTLIDYTGDGLCAVWGTPVDQPDHAKLACRAAIEMVQGLKQLPGAALISHATKVRIGLNTGPVLAGNVGSERFKKFGAHGMTINLGRRIESAGRYFRCPILLGEKTKDLLAETPEFPTRCLATIQGAGSVKPFEVHELACESPGDMRRWKQVYENALKQVEFFGIDQVKNAGYELTAWRKANEWDQPALVLMARMIHAAINNQLGEPYRVIKLGKD